MTLAIADGILLRACLISNLTPDAVRATSRIKEVVRVRHAVMYAVRRRTDWSLPMIARFLHLKDHTTVIYGIKAATIAYEREPEYAALIADLMFAPQVLPMRLDEHIRSYAVKLRSSTGEPTIVRHRGPHGPRPRKPTKEPTPVAAVKLVLAPLLPPVSQPQWEQIYVPGTHGFAMNENGDTLSDMYHRRQMRKASNTLVKALLSAFAARSMDRTTGGAHGLG